ncbi:hypothetical protein PIB30_068378 [Stylosanthes scabra]|uniref:Uncharacterized protein n=1 Tax=Stylosanthes scabra TaxID=79078 RepID=A0ABU6QNM5_9FABA|nr:hypothetical protein [Stylosanthes scabra]
MLVGSSSNVKSSGQGWCCKTAIAKHPKLQSRGSGIAFLAGEVRNGTHSLDNVEEEEEALLSWASSLVKSWTSPKQEEVAEVVTPAAEKAHGKHEFGMIELKEDESRRRCSCWWS